jgi:KDO2-lipid IV(A) lauroyltransferase
LLIAKILPKSFIYFKLKIIFLLGFYFLNSRRELTIKNLQKIYSFERKEAFENAKKVYLELSQTVAEILLMFVDRFDIDSAIVNLQEAKEKLSKLTSNAPNGIIVITAHYSNWELAAQFLARHGLAMLAIGRIGSNKIIERNITTPFREKYGNRAIDKNRSMVAMAKTLKNRGNIGMLIDQKTSGSHSVNVPFFGFDAQTTLSTASLKLKFDPLVVPISVVRVSRGKYKMYIDDPINYTANEIIDEKEKLVAMTAKYNQAIEHMISRDSNQWFWMHNRWRW